MKCFFFYFYKIFNITNYEGKKVKLEITVDSKKCWSFTETTKYTDERLVITEVIKKVFFSLYRGKKETSFREGKELMPIANLIKRILPKKEEEEEGEEENNELKKKKNREKRE